MIARPFGLAMIGGTGAFRPLQSLIMTLMIICHKQGCHLINQRYGHRPCRQMPPLKHMLSKLLKRRGHALASMRLCP